MPNSTEVEEERYVSLITLPDLTKHQFDNIMTSLSTVSQNMIIQSSFEEDVEVGEEN